VQIKLSELRDVMERLLSDLKGRGYDSFELPDDYYWDLPKDVLYDPYHDPSGFTLGQLTHDWERLQQIQAGKSEPLAYGLVWLSALLRAIGQRIVH
jgi:hypothetical protein